MSELEFANEFVTPAVSENAKENIVARNIVVYQTLIDPAVARIEGEKVKNKLFKRGLFNLGAPEEIEFSSIAKYYEPYVVVSGKYFIDYYRKSAYTVRVGKGAKEVILLGQTFTPKSASYSTSGESIINLEGEERLVKETRAFIILDRNGQETKLGEFRSAPSEENPQKLIKSFKMPEINPGMDLEVIRKRVVRRPMDINRVVDEELDIDERSVIYTPRFRLTYKSARLGKEACLEFDAVTSKQIKRSKNVFSDAKNAIVSALKEAFDTIKNA